MTAFVRDVAITPGGADVTTAVGVALPGAPPDQEVEDLVDLRVSIDTTPLRGISVESVVLANESGTCSAGTEHVVCDYPGAMRIRPRGEVVAFVVITPSVSAAVGRTVHVRAEASAAGTTTAVATGQVAVREGVQLRDMTPYLDVRAVEGDQIPLTPQVDNPGTVDVRGVVLLLRLRYSIRSETTFNNCTYYYPSPFVACSWPDVLTAGGHYQISQPMTLRIRPDTAGTMSMVVDWNWQTPADWTDELRSLQSIGVDTRAGIPGTGPRLDLLGEPSVGTSTMTPAPPQTNNGPYSSGGIGFIDATMNANADFTPVAEPVDRHGTAPFTVVVGVTNQGPATADEDVPGRRPANVTLVAFTPGTRVRRASPECLPVIDGTVRYDRPGQAGATDYVCRTGSVMPDGSTTLFSFTASTRYGGPIARVTVNYSATGYGTYTDTNPDNDTTLAG